MLSVLTNKGFSGGSKPLHITVFNDELGMLKETIVVSGSHVTKKVCEYYSYLFIYLCVGLIYTLWRNEQTSHHILTV